MGQILFAGIPLFWGGLSNEQELAQACPKKFKDDNPWSRYAMKLFYNGGNISNWKWKSHDLTERKTQGKYFEGLLESLGVRHEDKESIAGWMLSEMLVEVPEYVPGKTN